MKFFRTIIFSAFFACLVLYAMTQSSQDAYLLDTKCISCHSSYFFRDQEYDFKQWQLTVARMRNYSEMTDDEADLITDYLSSTKFLEEYFPDEYKSKEEEIVVVKADPGKEKVMVETETVVEVAQVAPIPPDQELAVLRKKYNVKRIWDPSRAFLKMARYVGYVSVFCLIMLAVSGLSRRKLKRNFKYVHRTFAYLLLLAVAIHVTIYLFKFGTPAVLWLWFGIAASLTLIFSESSGELRKRFKLRTFKLIHFSAGLICILGAILHWIWAWI